MDRSDTEEPDTPTDTATPPDTPTDIVKSATSTPTTSTNHFSDADEALVSDDDEKPEARDVKGKGRALPESTVSPPAHEGTQQRKRSATVIEDDDAEDAPASHQNKRIRQAQPDIPILCEPVRPSLHSHQSPPLAGPSGPPVPQMQYMP